MTPTPEQIEAFVAKHFDYKSRKHGAELVICNPFDGDCGYHFEISKVKGVCHDWRGDGSWAPLNERTGRRSCTFINFVQAYLKCSYRDAVRAVCGSDMPSRLGRPKAEPCSASTDRIKLPDGAIPLAGDETLAATVVFNWLASRGVSRAAAIRHSVHYNVADVTFPYFEWGDLVYWQTRNMLNKRFNFPDESKYGVGKGQFLYNFDQVEPAEELYIAESIFCCHTLVHQCLATGGADMTPQQARKVRLLGPRAGVVLVPDNDAAGLRSIVRNAGLLQTCNLKVYYSVPPELDYGLDGARKLTKDWNELLVYLKLNQREIWELMAKAINPYTMHSRQRLLELAAHKDGKRQKALPLHLGQRRFS